MCAANHKEPEQNVQKDQCKSITASGQKAQTVTIFGLRVNKVGNTCEGQCVMVLLSGNIRASFSIQIYHIKEDSAI